MRAEQRAERLGAQEVAPHLVLQVVFQSNPIAPGMWASAYSAGFSSTSTIRIDGSSRWSCTQLGLDQDVLRVVGH